MQHIPTLDEIKERAEAIHLTITGLARKAGIRPSTVSRGLKGKHEILSSTLRKLHGQLLVEEEAMRAHLAALPGAVAKPVEQERAPI